MSRAWVVRAGREGEHEQYNLDHGLATIGWAAVGEHISDATTREDVRSMIVAAYPNDSAPRLANYTGQVWAFRDSIKPGDLVVMPSKLRPGYLYFGRCAGWFRYDGAEPNPSRRKQLPVTWQLEPVAKAGIGTDLLNSLNAISTVFSPSKNNAVERLEAIAKGDPDPGAPEPSSSPQTASDTSTADVTDPTTVPTLEAIRDRVRAHVAANFKEHKLTGLVAEMLAVLGFQCEVSPPGPDGGVDILGGRGPLGLDAPTLIVEVKSEPSPIDVKVVRGLHSAMVQHKADQGLLVAWGGVTKPARKEFERDRTMFRVWDAETLLDVLFETYDRLPAGTRSQIPLRQVWVLDDEEAIP